MGDKPAQPIEDIWLQIDGTVRSLIGQRVYYNDGVHGKCLAFVTKAGYARDEGGILNDLIVFPPGGSPYPVRDVHLSSDRRTGTFDIAHPGDLTDSGKIEQPSAPEVVVDETPVTPVPLEETNAFDPLDTNRDGVVSNKERKGKG